MTSCMHVHLRLAAIFSSTTHTRSYICIILQCPHYTWIPKLLDCWQYLWLSDIVYEANYYYVHHDHVNYIQQQCTVRSMLLLMLDDRIYTPHYSDILSPIRLAISYSCLVSVATDSHIKSHAWSVAMSV